MKLSDISADMKTHARAFPDSVVMPGQPLAHGARLKLKYIAATNEFRLQVQRVVTLPDAALNPKGFNAWHTELETFAREFESGLHARVEYQSGERTYAAVITWRDPDAEFTADELAEMENTQNYEQFLDVVTQQPNEQS